MPSSDSRKDNNDPPEDSIKDVDRDTKAAEAKEKNKGKGSSKSMPSHLLLSLSVSILTRLLLSLFIRLTAKDLSHVPCKFFKVGSCTAGSSCPFSHTVLEPGQQKEVCAWFVKGNCKFGHKCALAHILPGQSMSMDRKNKKAAQLAASASGAGSGSTSGAGGREGGGSRSGKAQKSNSQSGNGGGGAQARSTLLTGSTAPTRTLSSAARPSIPMPLKATLSPSAPAPPVKDTDFASFGLPDEANQLPSAPAQGKSGSSQGSPTEPPDDTLAISHDEQPEVEISVDREGSPSLHINSGSTPRRGIAAERDAPGVIDFGPIGSPPRASPSANRVPRLNGFSPGTSPQARGGLSSSPFSAPGSQSVFVVHQEDSSDFRVASGLSASLGNMMSWVYDRDSAQTRRSVARGQGISSETVVEDEDLEEFLPSSLTDLLSPEERSRRFSRTNGVRPMLQGGVEGELKLTEPRQSTEAHHRHSRSVPAPSLLRDIRSIWGEQPAVGSPDTAGTPGLGGLGNGTPSSFQSNSGFAARSPGDLALSPSNASAAFLPGLHHHFLNAKASTGLQGGGAALYPGAAGAMRDLSSTSYGAGFDTNGPSARLNAFSTRPPPFDSALSDPHFADAPPRSTSGRPIPSGLDAFAADGDDRRHGLSPSTRALQAHAPGQSLPQGLAAGYSRIHALPPPPVIPSPTGSGAFSVGQAAFSPGTKILGQSSAEWHSASPNAGSVLDHAPISQGLSSRNTSTTGSSLGGLETVFSRLSYSAAASREFTHCILFKNSAIDVVRLLYRCQCGCFRPRRS